MVARAGIAKGTFFAHFTDKDGLLVQLIAERLNAALDRMEALPPPGSADAMPAALDPLLGTLTDARIVFDIAMRFSGGKGPEEGMQAFAAQTVPLRFCEVTSANPAERLGPFLRACLEVR